MERVGIFNVEGLSPLIAVLAGIVLLVFLTPTIFGRKWRLPPGNLGFPILGDDTWRLLHERDFLMKKNKELGPFCKGRLLGRKTIYISETKEIRRLLAAEHDLVEASWPPSMITMLGTESIGGTFFDAHKKLRRVLNTAFTARAIRDYLPRVQQLADQFVRNLSNAKPALAYPELQYFAFQVIAELIIGFDESWFSGETGTRIRKAWKAYTAGLVCVPIYLPGTAYWNGLEARRFLVSKIDKSLLMVKEELKSLPHDAPRRISHKLLEAKDEKGRPFTQKQLQDLCVNILWAGHDTTASSLVMLMKELSQHPQVMQKLREEQHQVIKAHGTEMTESALRDMSFCDAVMKENLRTNVIAQGVPRVALKSFIIGDIYDVPKGWGLFLCFGAQMKDDPVWAHAEAPAKSASFHPDRWLAENATNSTAFLPFGAGPRICLGYPLAQVEIKVLLATLARGYAWELEDPDEEWIPFPLQMPMKGLPLRFYCVDKA